MPALTGLVQAVMAARALPRPEQEGQAPAPACFEEPGYVLENSAVPLSLVTF